MHFAFVLHSESSGPDSIADRSHSCYRVLGQDTELLQCLFSPSRINGYWEPVKGTRRNVCVTPEGVASHPGGAAILPLASFYGKRENVGRVGQSDPSATQALSQRKKFPEWKTINRRLPYLGFMMEVVVLGYQLNNSVWDLIHVWWCNGWVCVLAHCMKLITFLQKRESTKILLEWTR